MKMKSGMEVYLIEHSNYQFLAISSKFFKGLLLVLALALISTKSYSQKKRGYIVRVSLKNAISTFVSSENFCAGSNTDIRFSPVGIFNIGNSFVAQLSSASGSFENPVELGKISGRKGNEIAALIPSGTTTGLGYRIRVIATSPVTVSKDNQFDIAIREVPGAVITVNRPVNFSKGSPVTLIASSGEKYTWSNGENSRSVMISEPGTYTVKVSNENGCGTVSSATVVAADLPTFDATVANADPTGKNGTITIAAIGGDGEYAYSIDGGKTFVSSNVFAGLTNGNYKILVKSNGVESATQNVPVLLTQKSYPRKSVKLAISNTANIHANKTEMNFATGKVDPVFTVIRTYPNPAMQSFQLSLGNMKQGKARVQVMSAEGSVVFQQWINIITSNQTFPINMSTQSAGMYFVKVISGSDIKTAKVIVKG